MSHPPPPPPVYFNDQGPTSAAMIETQRAPTLPPPSFLGQPSNRRLPQPVQLPPLSIPLSSGRQEYQTPPTLPPFQSAPPSVAGPRPYSRSVAPVEKLLSNNPYTPPRSDSAYSPQYGLPTSPRTEYESRQPPRPMSERRLTDEQRPMPPDPYLTPVDPMAKPPFSHPQSPTYASNYPPGYGSYRGSVSSHRSSGSSSYAAPPAPQPAPAAQPSASAPTRLGLPPEKSDLQYTLRLRQQPEAARACGFGERDRRVIDPPPIVQLMVTDPQTGSEDLEEMRYTLNVVHCTLWNADGTSEETALVQPDRRTTRRLMGQLVASPSVAKDEHNVEGCFFCFPDLSCRTHGRYRLRFVLMRIDPVNLHVGGFSPILTEVLSDVFTVYTAKDFPGMKASSALTRALKLQGCNIQVKKGKEILSARKRSITNEDDDDGDRSSGKGKRRHS